MGAREETVIGLESQAVINAFCYYFSKTCHNRN